MSSRGRFVQILSLALLLPMVPAQGQEPVVVALAIDTSGSLAQADLDLTRILAVRLLQELPPGSEMAVYSFDDQARQELTRTSNRDRLEEEIRGLEIGGRYTALHDALFKAAEYLRQQPVPRKALVIVSDGRDENSAASLDDGLGEAKAGGIPVFTIGVGRRVEDRDLRRMALLSGGEYFPIADIGGSLLADAIQGSQRDRDAPPPPPSDTSSATNGEGAPPPPPPASPTDAKQPGRNWVFWGAIGLIIAVIFALSFVLHRLWQRPSVNACPTCGTLLPAPGVPCPNCQPPSLAGDVRRTGTERLPPPSGGAQPSPMSSPRPENVTKTRLLRVAGATLTIVEGPGSGHTFSLNLKAPTIIGRGPDATVRLEDNAVSQKQCKLDFARAAFILTDLGSTNGTWRNESNIGAEPAILEDGDRVRVGSTVLLLGIEEAKPDL